MSHTTIKRPPAHSDVNVGAGERREVKKYSHADLDESTVRLIRKDIGCHIGLIRYCLAKHEDETKKTA
jgi:hypothetical protein